MNIIKLKDKIMSSPINEKSDFFNKRLKGKYAYWIRMRYVLPMEDITFNEYSQYEDDLSNLTKMHLDVNDPELNMINYIDFEETNKVNNIDKFITINSYVTDDDITLDEIKVFRTWLAKELLSLSQYTESENIVLNYYANNMMDSTISALMYFGQSVEYINGIQTSSCGCSHSSNLSSLYLNSLSTCDSINIYKTNIYNKMVDMFSETAFWIDLPKEFIITFKHYIDNIIKVNLPLEKSDQSKYVDCLCTDTNTQSKHISTLNNLSTSLGYIYEDDITGHKNFIRDSFNSWATYLYEGMQW